MSDIFREMSKRILAENSTRINEGSLREFPGETPSETLKRIEAEIPAGFSALFLVKLMRNLW